MSTQQVLLPLFVEIALTFLLLFWMAWLRRIALRRREVRYDEIALREPNWPRRTLAAANCFQNQLELPILFYVLTILAYVTRHAGLTFVVLAWIFVVSRLLHAGVHVSINKVPLRGALFGFGAVTLAIMWTIYMIEFILGV